MQEVQALLGTSEVEAGARVWLQLSPSSLPAEGATSETEKKKERQEALGEEGEAGGGSKKEGAGGGARWAGGCLRGSGSHARRLCLYTVRSRPPARSLPACSRFIVLQVGSPAAGRRDPSRAHRLRVRGRGGPGAPPHPPRFSRDPPAAEAEPAGHSSELAHPPAPPERGRKGKQHSSLGSPLFLALSNNLFRETLREEDIFLNPLSGWSLPLPCGATSATLPSAETPGRRVTPETGS